MASFDVAIVTVLFHEGGYVDNPDDPGGATNFGISSKVYPALDIKNLTEDQAKAIYLKDYWKFDGLANQDLATKLLDLEVNLGQGTAIKLAQRAIGIKDDGVWGPVTEAGLNRASPSTLLTELRARACTRHALIAIAEPKQSVFILGWFRRDCS